MAIGTLCGPPQIHAANTDGDTTMETLQNLSLNGSGPQPQFGFTENNSLTYTATGNPCLDFFFHVVPDTPSQAVLERLQEAWTFSPLTTLKLVCNLRGVRGTGKSDKERFYTAALWLHKNHPKTLACNSKVFAEFGYYKDLLEILYRLLEGENVRQREKAAWLARKARKGKGTARAPRRMGFRGRRRTPNITKEKKPKMPKLPRDARVAQNVMKEKLEREQARALRKEKLLAMAKKAFERYTRDPDYRFLHDRVSDMFADDLKADLQHMNAGQFNKVSLASKWCPTIDSSFDKATLICESIARKVFPLENHPEYDGIEEAHYVYRVRDRLRKEVLVPLHKILELPEVYMSGNRWESLPYNRVPSVAMKNYKTHFLKHDEERFKGYLEDVKAGKSTMAAGALLPHEIIASLNDADGGQVSELHWARMVGDLGKKGKLNNCIAVCDVSGSMSGTPMEVCVALGLMISELSEEPWKGKVITFSANPQLHKVEGESLLEKTQFVRRMEWGGNTNFQKVFDRILDVAVAGKLSEDEIIKRVFVFSDMEFDEASGHSRSGYSHYYQRCGVSDSDDSDSDVDMDIRGSLRQRKKEEKQRRPKGWKTDYEVIKEKFRAKGFNRVPEIVFWNLRSSNATPVTSNQDGVALVSGFSKNMVKMFLENDGIISPVIVMEQAISGELYQKLVVLD